MSDLTPAECELLDTMRERGMVPLLVGNLIASADALEAAFTDLKRHDEWRAGVDRFFFDAAAAFHCSTVNDRALSDGDSAESDPGPEAEPSP